MGEIFTGVKNNQYENDISIAKSTQNYKGGGTAINLGFSKIIDVKNDLTNGFTNTFRTLNGDRHVQDSDVMVQSDMMDKY